MSKVASSSYYKPKIKTIIWAKDIFNNLEKTHVIETNKRPKNNGIQRGGHGDSKDNSFQNKLFS